MNKSINKSVNENMGKDIDKSNNKNMNNGDVINRLDVVRKYNPHLNNVDAKSPLTVGNWQVLFHGRCYRNADTL